MHNLEEGPHKIVTVQVAIPAHFTDAECVQMG